MIEKIWIDVETTGLDIQKNTIIELAAIYKNEMFHKYVKLSYMPYNFNEVSEITGITWDFLQENGVSELELYETFIDFLDNIVDKYNKDNKLVISGYNTQFDSEFIRNLFKRYNNNYYGSYFLNVNYEVMSEVANAICNGEIDLLENYKLETVCKFFNIEFNAHSAIEDIRATIELNNKIQERYNDKTL